MYPHSRDVVRTISHLVYYMAFDINFQRFMLQKSIQDSLSLVEIVPQDHHWRLQLHVSGSIWQDLLVRISGFFMRRYPPLPLDKGRILRTSALKARTLASRMMKRHLIIFNLCFQARAPHRMTRGSCPQLLTG
ncbi:hypothetical protein J3459_006137 [Metarhizium acridum]|nr:hypothetical protein J3459_006137 [Metarhizium acridum]